MLRLISESRNSADNDASTDMAAAFISMLDDDNVITKLSKVLSTFINLIFDEKLNSVIDKLEKIIKDNSLI